MDVIGTPEIPRSINLRLGAAKSGSVVVEQGDVHVRLQDHRSPLEIGNRVASWPNTQLPLKTTARLQTKSIILADSRIPHQCEKIPQRVRMHNFRLYMKQTSSLRRTCIYRIIQVNRIVAVHAIAIILMSVPDASSHPYRITGSVIALPSSVVICLRDQKLGSKIHSSRRRRSRQDTCRIDSRYQNQCNKRYRIY